MFMFILKHVSTLCSTAVQYLFNSLVGSPIELILMIIGVIVRVS
jgi:hypothetical protein